jgi:hypothetical protein
MTDTGNIHAEVRREDFGDGSGYTMRYLVFNGDIIGSYGLNYRADGTPHTVASRDYHQLATSEQVALQLRFDALPDDDKWEGDNFPPSSGTLNKCDYHDHQDAFCDGSYMVEVTEDEQRSFEIAAMMAGVERDHA